MKRHILNLSVTVELWEKLMAASKKIDSSVTQYIRLAIIEKLKREE